MSNENAPSVSVQPLAWWSLPPEGGPLDGGPLDADGKLREGWPPIGEAVLVQGPEGSVAFRVFDVAEGLDIWVGVADEERHQRPVRWAQPIPPYCWPMARRVLRQALGLRDDPDRGCDATGRNHYTISKQSPDFGFVCDLARRGFMVESSHAHDGADSVTFHVTPAGKALVV